MIRKTEKEQESGKGREVETRVQGTEMKGWALLTLETLNRAPTSLTKSTLVVPILIGFGLGALWDVGSQKVTWAGQAQEASLRKDILDG